MILVGFDYFDAKQNLTSTTHSASSCFCEGEGDWGKIFTHTDNHYVKLKRAITYKFQINK